MANEASYRELDLWVREELSQHGEWLVDRFIEALEKNRNVDSGALVDSIDYRTREEQGAQVLEISFPLYGRMAEARYSRLRKGGRNRDAMGTRQNRKVKKVQWYNRNRYAGYGRLLRRLSAGMSDAELRRIRGILEEAKARLAGNK